MSMFRELLINNALSSKQIDYLNMPLTIQTLEENNTITLIHDKAVYENQFLYKINNGTWADLSGGFGILQSITLKNVGDKISFKQNATSLTRNFVNTYNFSSTKNFNVYGNIMSLVQGDRELSSLTTIEHQYQFYNLFCFCWTLINAQNLQLPATTLAPHCYESMFAHCNQLQKAPKLPATNLADNCYYKMFYTCNQLPDMPQLPATILSKNCYESMFYYCINLTKIYLSAEILTSKCYFQMFKQCINISEVHMDFLTNNITYSTDAMFFCDPQFSRIIPEIYVKNITKTEFLNNNGFNIFAPDNDFFTDYTITTTVHAKDQTFSWTYEYQNELE